jgi:hypothetical protein
MNHPSELLAEYVDGTLPERERAVVAAHLRGCATCRGEVAAAERARRALRELPRPAVPSGLARDALAAAATAGPAGPGRWARAGGLAAAAALVVILAVSLPRLLGNGEAGAPTAMDAAAPDGIERLEGNLDARDLESLAQEAPLTAASAEGAAGDLTGPALRCLRRAYPDVRDATPVRVAEASFRGVDAYVGVFERGPGAGQPPDTRIALAVSSSDCSILSFSSVTIPRGE